MRELHFQFEISGAETPPEWRAPRRGGVGYALLGAAVALVIVAGLPPEPPPPAGARGDAQPTELAYSAAEVGAAGEEQLVLVSSTGEAPLNISQATVEGDAAADFSIVANECPPALAPNESCTIRIRFAPAQEGPRAAFLDIVTDTGGAPLRVPLTGTGNPRLTPPPTVATAEVRPGELRFGEFEVGGGAERPAQLANTGSAALQISGVSIGGGAANDFAITANDCPAELPQKENCTIRIRFRPSAAGGRAATLNISTNGTVTPPSVPLTGVGTIVDGQVSPPNLDFAVVELGSTSADRSVTVTNTGSARLQVNSVAIREGAGSDFSIVANDCSNPVASGASCTISVRFRPRGAEDRSGTLEISTSAASFSVPLTGRGTRATRAVAEFDSTEVDFGDRDLKTRTQQTIAVTSTGSAPLRITSVTLAGDADFAIVQNGCDPSPMEAGDRCAVVVSFTPNSPGEHAAQIDWVHNAAGSPRRALLRGRGIGQRPIVEREPNDLNFSSDEVGSSKSKKVELRNHGPGALEVQGLNVSGPGQGDYQAANGCTSPVAPNKSCSILVTFSPQAKGSSKARLEIISNAANAPLVVSLRGQGVIRAAITIEPQALNFESVRVGSRSETQSVTVTNRYSGQVRITSVRIADTGSFGAELAAGFGVGSDQGNFTRIEDRCSNVTLDPGRPCTISVAFTPKKAGSLRARIFIRDSVSSGEQNVTLSGTAVGQPPPTPDGLNPGSPYPTRPAYTCSAVLSWNPVSTSTGPASYILTLERGAEYDGGTGQYRSWTTVLSQNISGNRYNLGSLSGNTGYRWNVSSRDASGNVSAPSPWYYFTCLAGPG